MTDALTRQLSVATGGRASPSPERVLVCVSSRPQAVQLVRAAHRVAAQSFSDWMAVNATTAPYVSDAARERVSTALRLAEQLGAETARLTGSNAAEEVLRYARERRVRRIILGKSPGTGFSRFVRPSFAEELVRGSGDIEVCFLSGDPVANDTAGGTRAEPFLDARGIAVALVTVVVCTVVSAVVFGRSQPADVAMVYLLGTVLASLRYGRGVPLVATILSVLTFDFFFFRPYYSFRVEDPRSLLTFVVMFFVATIISGLARRVRAQAATASERETRTARLYAMSKELASTPDMETLLGIAVKHLHDAFDAEVAILLPNPSGGLGLAVAGPHTFALDEQQQKLAEWVFAHERKAGAGTDTASSAAAIFLPLRASRGKVGVLGVRPREERRLTQAEQRNLLDAFAAQIASAAERGQLAEAARRAQVEVETEQMRSSLLSSVSHDLRTPLGVITGATSTLLQNDGLLDAAARRDLLETAHEEAERLGRLVRNLLDMTRLSAGRVYPAKEWHPLDEVIGVALNRLEETLRGREVKVDLPSDLPPVPIDAVLIEQVLVNLLENAIKYTPEGAPIDISARAKPNAAEVTISDRGPGVPPTERHRIFEKFYRLRPDGAEGGAGLGLAICRGIIEAHGGRIWVEGRLGSGASFHFTLPIEGVPPIVARDTWSRAS